MFSNCLNFKRRPHPINDPFMRPSSDYQASPSSSASFSSSYQESSSALCFGIGLKLFSKEKNGYKHNADTETYKEEHSLEAKTSDITFEKIISFRNIQKEVSQYIEFLKKPGYKTLLQHGMSITRGCLLIGPNGSGKRTIAHAIAGEANVGLFEVSDVIPYPDIPFEHKLVCNWEKVDVQDMLKIARSHAPCVIFIDNIDVIMEICRPLIQQILHEMENFRSNEGIVFLGAVCKEPEGIDEMILCRSNRFNKMIRLTGPKVKISDITFDKIVSFSNIQEEARQYIEFLKSPQTFLESKISMPRACLLIGSNGSGKRTIAHAIAGEASVGIFEVSDAIPRWDIPFDHNLLCNGERVDVQGLFENARSHAPCVIFINNLDVIIEICRPLVQQILHEMEKIKTNEGIVLLGAVCEKPEGIEEKLLCRSNKFENQMRLTAPLFQERKELLTFFLRDIKHDNTLDVDILARLTEDYEVGNIKRLLDRCMIRAIMQHNTTITLEDVENVIDDIRVGAANKKFISDKESLKGTAYHEAGHALVRYYSQEKDPLYKVTIVPREWALGITYTLPEGPDKDMTRRRLLSLIDVCFGGIVAEEMIFGKECVTTGCGDDMEHATSLAEQMVKEWSMSENLGFRVYQDSEFGFSDDIKKKVEVEIDFLLQESYERVKSLLSQHKSELDLIANALLLKKTLYGDDVQELIEKSLSTASGTTSDKNKAPDKSPNVVVKRTFSKTATEPITEEE